jgi:hypothetical protein
LASGKTSITQDKVVERRSYGLLIKQLSGSCNRKKELEQITLRLCPDEGEALFLDLRRKSRQRRSTLEPTATR